MFPFNFFLAAFAGAFLTTLLALPLWRKWCLHTNLLDDPRDGKNYDAPKIHSGAVPLAGGFAVLTGILLPLIAGAGLIQFGLIKISFANLIAHGLERRGVELAVIALGAIAITILGWFDDKHELKPLPKLLGQFLIALLVALTCKRITLFVHSEAFSYAITILWLLTVINAFGEYLVAITGFLMCGALAGFLPWNFPNARAFLGDAGSHLIGYLLAVMAILPHFYTKQNLRPFAVLAPLFVLAIPLIDIAQVSLLRTFNKKPFWIGDTNHLSHRLTRVGLNRTRAVLLLWLFATIIGAVACWL